MAEGDLRPGTRVMFVREIRTPSFKTARALEIARVVRVIDLVVTPSPFDRFEVEYRGERFVVRREDIALPLGT
jgi:hypothetical protein